MARLIDILRRSSSAEDLFDYFDLSYDPAVLAAAESHILKQVDRFVATLPEDADEDAMHEAAATLLASVHADVLGAQRLELRLLSVEEARRHEVPAYRPLYTFDD